MFLQLEWNRTACFSFWNLIEQRVTTHCLAGYLGDMKHKALMPEYDTAETFVLNSSGPDPPKEYIVTLNVKF